MLDHRWTCEQCGVQMSATDPFTLNWGVEQHVCSPGQVEHLSVPGRDAVEAEAVLLLIGLYGAPFVFYAAEPGRCPLVVT